MQKELCMLYFLNPIDIDFEHELIGLLEEESYEYTVLKSVMEFKSWKRLSNKQLPSLFITDLSHYDEAFSQVIGSMNDSTIFCVNEKFTSAEIEIEGNMVHVFSSYEDVLERFTETEGEEELFILKTPPEHAHNETDLIDTNNYTVPNDMDSQLDSGGGENAAHDYQEDVDPYMTPHPSIQMITEFKKERVPILHGQVIQSIKKNPVESENPPDYQMENSDCPQQQEETKQHQPLAMRPREIQQQIFSQRQRETHRSIGIWSPIHRMGVTSMTINFAIFLSHQKYDVAVIEGLTNDYSMKDWLKRYIDIPKDWYSYAKAIQTNVDASPARWIYEEVMFLPLDKDDPQYEWDKDSLEVYMNTTKLNDVTLVDLPTGEMMPYTKSSLQYLDQLWIVVDDSIQETIAWSNYITALKKEVSCPIFLVFNKHYPFSQSRELAKTLKLPVISCIPALHEETMRNYYETAPLYLLDGLKERLDEPFSRMAKALFGDKFTFVEKGVPIPDVNWQEKLFGPIRTLLKPLKNN